jgi:hypothetical protein
MLVKALQEVFLRVSDDRGIEFRVTLVVLSQVGNSEVRSYLRRIALRAIRPCWGL